MPPRRGGSLGNGPTCIAAIALALAAANVAAAPLSVYCTHDPDACDLAAQTFTRDTGVAVAMVRKPTGEVFAQLRAERDNPKSDVWYGGTFDSFLQGSAEGLFAPYRSPRLSELYPWAQRQSTVTSDRAVAIYRIVLGFGTNSTLLAKKQLVAPRCWADLVKPEYRNEIELSNPVTSGTGYTILATLISLYGEDGAFDYLRRLRPNVVRYTQSGTAQGPSVARGEVGIGVSFVHEFITQQLSGFPVDIAVPCEGTGDALGGMAIVANGPNPAEARMFYDWALTRSAQELANRTRNLILPANKAAEIRPEAARFASAPTIDADPAKFGAPAEKKRLLARWQREIGDASN
jgi:iron(III) transport system substrate-binding protein